MTVNAILKAKGDDVFVLGPDERVEAAAALLTTRRIGALLVMGPEGQILGILSERDIVRGIAEQGAAVLARPVRVLMTGEVLRCARGDTVADIMTLMTARRIRHLPVVENGRLVGVVSIGDVVKIHVAEKELEAESLRRYITAG
jgi:CBS domain-containing protein